VPVRDFPRGREPDAFAPFLCHGRHNAENPGRGGVQDADRAPFWPCGQSRGNHRFHVRSAVAKVLSAWGGCSGDARPACSIPVLMRRLQIATEQCAFEHGVYRRLRSHQTACLPKAANSPVRTLPVRHPICCNRKLFPPTTTEFYFLLYGGPFCHYEKNPLK